MGMTANMTDKDKKLLIFLAFFAVIAIFGFLIIKPLVQKNAEYLVQANELRAEKEAYERKKQELPMLRVQNTENQQKINLLKSGFEAKLQSQEIENKLTERALAAGLHPTKLTIKMPKEPLKLNVYPNSSIALSAEPAVEETTYVKKAEAEADAVEAAAKGGAEEKEKTKKGGEIAAQTFVSSAEVTMEMEGTREQLEGLIDDYANNTPSMRVTSIQWGGGKDGKAYTLKLGLEVNMCEKDSEE